jgi:O-antigen ligase
VINICDRAIEYMFYGLLFFVTFSNSLVEIAATVMITAWIIKRSVSRDFSFFKRTEIRLLLLYLVWVLLSCFNSSYFSESFRGIFKVLESILVFTIPATELKGRDIVKRTLTVLCLSVTVVCLNGLYQYFAGTGLIRHRQLIHLDYLRRISSSFVHPNSLGIYLSVCATVLTSFMVSKASGPVLRWAVCLPWSLSLVCLFLTRSRGAWMAFAFSLFLLAIMRAKRVLVAFIIAMAVIIILMPPGVRNSLREAADISTGTTRERVMLWKGTAGMIKQHPVLGFGINTYSKVFPEYKPPEYADYRYTHNCYLQMASEIGIPGMLIFLAFLGTVFFRCWNWIYARTISIRRTMGTGLTAGLAGFAAASAVDTHLYSLTLSVFFYLLLGYTTGMTFYEEK